ncbi:MAG: gamma carbonic anhydrase family protein [Evtepia sp.]
MTSTQSEHAWIAPGAVLQGSDIRLGAETSIWYHAVLRADNVRISIGHHSNIQDCCVIHGDLGNHVTVGDYVTLGHGAILHGCTVGNRCLIGMNAVVLDHAEIGDGSIIGAGAVVPAGMKVPPNSMVLGMPGKIKRQVTPEEVAHTVENAEAYVKLAQTAL